MIQTELRLHAPNCGFCCQETEAPKRSLYDMHLKSTVRLCSEECYFLYVDMIQRIGEQIRIAKMKTIQARILTWMP